MSEYYQERKRVSYFYNDLRGQFLDESIVCQDTIKSSGERQGKGEKRATKLCQIEVTRGGSRAVHAKFIASFTCYRPARAFH